jgi:peroxiredoxin
MSKELLIVWQGRNEKSSGIIAEDDDVIVVYLDKNSFLERWEKDIEAYKNRIKVLQNLNTKYREKLGISNEPVDALGLISPLDDVAQAE